VPKLYLSVIVRLEGKNIEYLDCVNNVLILFSRGVIKIFVPTVGPVTSDIMFILEAPGEAEDRTGLPLQGRAGNTFNTLLSQAGIIRSKCLIANVARERPPANDIKHYFVDKGCKIPTPRMLEYIALLQKEIETYKPNVVIAMGNTAMWALTGRKGIKHARGSVATSTLVPGQKVLMTYHPQAVGYDWGLATTVVMDLKKALYHSRFPEVPEDKRQLIIDPTKAHFIELCQQLLDEKEPVAVDIEAVQAHINRIGFSNSNSTAFTLGILNGIVPLFPENDELEIWEWIGRVISELPIIYHNAVYDLPVLFLRNGIPTPNLYMDTLVAAHILWPELPKSLEYVTSILLDVPAWKHLSDASPGDYNALDALNTKAISIIMENLLKKRDLWETFQREMSWIEPASMLQLQGLYVDMEKKDELIEVASKKLEKIDEMLLKLVGKEVNYNSPAQVKNLLYIDLELPPQYKRRKNAREERKITTGEDALKKLARMHEVPALIIERRKASKLISTFLDISVSPEGRVHSSYNVTGTGFGGRWSSSKSIILPYGPGNLQNIPKEARTLYTIPKGYVLLEADYIQAEAVVVAYLCLDTVLMKLFKDAFGMSGSERAKGYDVHRYTASLMYDIPIGEVTKEQRTVGKTMRHASNYASGPGVLANKLDISMAEAKPLLKLYYQKNHLLPIWHQKVQIQLRQDRTMINLFGRKHRFLDRWGDSLFRSAYAYIPQSSIGELLNISLREIYDELGNDIQIYLQLHDGVYSIVREDEVLDVMKALRKIMIKEIPVGRETMEIDVSFAVGKDWGSMIEQDISWK
jgi:uracil-DNA glycosylase family 4